MFEMFFVTTIANLVFCMLRKIYLDTNNSSGKSFSFFTFVTSLICSFIFFFQAIGGSASQKTIIISVLYGLICALQYYFFAHALRTGYYSLTMAVLSLSTVIPAFSGLCWGEEISAWQIVGMALMSVFFILIITDVKKQKLQVKWILSCSLLFLLTGLIGVLQKWHQSSAVSAERGSFLFIAFSVTTVLSLLLYIIEIKLFKKTNENSQEKITFKRLIAPAVIIIISAIGLAVNNFVNLYLTGKMLSAVFFPIINGASVTVNILAGVILFKEKLTLKICIGIATAVVATICLCI